MIRDPSDGSVREAPKIEARIPTELEPMIPASGLRAPSQKPAVQARLERDRAWLKKYLSERKGQR